MAPYRETVGLIAPCDADEKLAAFAKAKGFGWPRDVMRHSFISYAVALTQQIGQVALWAGNSESIVKRHCLERVTEEEGRAYFAILRNQRGNVVPMGRTAKG